MVGPITDIWQITGADGLPTTFDRFAHILLAISSIEATLDGLSKQELVDDWKRRMALERMLEIISVASEHIPANMKAGETDIDWHALVDLGKRLENTRDRIEAEVLWTISHHELPPLKACAERHLCEHNEPSS
jgi:uncharacterized protein with HEPN domain